MESDVYNLLYMCYVHIEVAVKFPTSKCLLSYFFKLSAPCVLYIGQGFRYSPENAFYIFNQQIHFIL